MFDENTKQKLMYYVYALIDPTDNKPFYIGKGKDNRIFNHLNCVLTDIDITNMKYDKIREINKSGRTVEHVIIRHGLTESHAFEIEAGLIDYSIYCGILLSNIMGGHNSLEKGLMTSDEIKRIYNTESLNDKDINDKCIIININKKYQRGKGIDYIYNATKGIWVIDKKKLPNIEYVLSEYKGLIIEVFKVDKWSPLERGFNTSSKKYGQTRIGYGFDGIVAPDDIRTKYINKSIAHTKKKGNVSPIRYKLT